MPTVVDHVEAALLRLTREEIAALPAARRARLKAQLGACERVCDELGQLQPEEAKLYVAADAQERLQAEEKGGSGILGDLSNGHRAE
jgi:hypothetical protein